MDRPQPVTAELVSDLRNLRQLNRHFGSHALITHFLRRWIQPGMRLRVLDLATGSGDLPEVFCCLALELCPIAHEVASMEQRLMPLEIL